MNSAPHPFNRAAAVALFATLGLAACTSNESSGGGGGSVTLSSVQILPGNVTIETDGTQAFELQATYSDGSTDRPDAGVTWRSLDESVVTIDSDGVATAVSEGVADVEGSYEDVTATATVTVSAPPTLSTVDILPATATLASGSTQAFELRATYSDGSVDRPDTGVSWRSLDESVVTIDSSGLATAVAEGIADVEGSFEGSTATATVTVSDAPPTLQSLSLDPAVETAAINDTVTFTLTATYSDGSSETPASGVTWSSEPESVATVDNSGVATAVAEGSATITAAFGGLETTASLTVSGMQLTYNARVRRTAFGVPHIDAAEGDYGSLGYGLGYAQAEDNLCVLLDDIITDRGERAKYFGPDGDYFIRANGNRTNNVDSDFFWKFMATQEEIDHLKSVSLPEAVATSKGFADGFTRYINEIRAGAHPGRHAECRDAGWLIDLTEDDMYRRYIRLGLIASSSFLANEISTAQPPGGGGSGEAQAELSLEEMKAALANDPGPLSFYSKDRPFGSNMYGLGPDATENGIPIVFGNPHFPWTGTERLYIFHARLGDSLDIMGSALYGVPAVLIGFTDHFAWSHTVSTAYRFGFYELQLSPDDPTAYVYDGEVRQMEAVPVTIEVLQEDGSLLEQSRTLYRTHFGPMAGLNVSGQNILPWTNTKAYAVRDANYENDRLINQFFHWNRAQSLREFIDLHASVLGIPWVNTVASGPEGPAYYGDVSVVPHVTDAMAQTCSNSAQAQALATQVPGLPLLDGSRSDCEWGDDTANTAGGKSAAPASGIFGAANLPTLERDDWVHNCNDSYWATNPAEFLTGFNSIIGDEETARTLRTRLCMLQVMQRLDGSDGLPGNKFNIEQLKEVVLSSRIYSAELALSEVTGSYCQFGSVLTQEGPVDVSEACTVLGNWDLKNNLESVGGHIWRQFFSLANGAQSSDTMWTTPFNAADPANTPSGFNVANPEFQDAFGLAVKGINDSGVGLDTPMGTLQLSGVHGDIPIPGGMGFEGAFTIVSGNSRLNSEGRYRINFGNSYIQAVTWQPDGSGWTPEAYGFITYSQSTDPASPHFKDFTEAYSQKQWLRFPFEEVDVAAQTVSTLQLTE